MLTDIVTLTVSSHLAVIKVFRMETYNSWVLSVEENELLDWLLIPELSWPPPSHLSHQPSHSLLANPFLKLNSTPLPRAKVQRERENKDITNPEY
jgi:hypothetical protein